MRTFILALDQGTTSSRAILFDLQGNIVDSAQREFPQYYPMEGYVEHDPEEILASQWASVREVLQRQQIQKGEVSCIGITNQRETTVVWERETGRPIHPAIVWQCRRTAPLCEQLLREGMGEHIRKTTGLLVDAYFSATKLRYILDAVPNGQMLAENGALLFGTVDTYLIWHLTGRHVTDYSNASRTMLFDLRRLDYDPLLLKRLNIPQCCLPEPRPSAEVYGTVQKGILGLEVLEGVPVSGAAGDQQAALFGQMCFRSGEAKCTYGTGSFLVMQTGETPVESNNRLLTTVAWGIGDSVCYALEGSIFNAGSSIKWLRDEVGLISSAAEIDVLAASVSDAGGTYFVSAFTGLGAPHWDMYARGALVGLTRGTNRAHIARAVLEGIAHQVCDLARTMEVDSKKRISVLNVDGGASVSDVMMQFQADLLGIPVLRPQCVESTALGAALLAGIGAGVYRNVEMLSGFRKDPVCFRPDMGDVERSNRMRGWAKAVEKAKHWTDL